jgi:hypothetical protein
MNPLIIKFFSVLFLISVLHKYYVSTTLIDYDEESNYFEITLKTFYDDLETELKVSNIDYVIQYDEVNELYEEYLKKNFLLSSNRNEIDYEYLGFEKKNDQINLYLQFDVGYVSNNLTIQNKILYESFPNQKNIVLYRHNKSRKSFIQDQKNQISLIKINP